MTTRRNIHAASLIWCLAALTALAFSFVRAGAGLVFLAEAPLIEKIGFLARMYVWPGCLAFIGLTLLQLQFRLSAAGQPVGATFGMSVLASLTLMHGIEAAATTSSIPAYVTGMALSYTALSRIYAIYMRRWGRISIPWVVWRGNKAAVAEMDRRVAALRAPAAGRS